MTNQELSKLKADKDGLEIYEYLANNVGDETLEVDTLIDLLSDVDTTGQYMASAARFLNAIDRERFEDAVRRLVSLTIDRDREHCFLMQLMSSIYGDDFAEHADELAASDNNFRRIFKRLYPSGAI